MSIADSDRIVSAAGVNAAPQASERIQSIDLLRGLVMILMALDHVRDFFHSSAMVGSPTNLAATTPATFLTRWITHFCAPVFLLLAGVSARLWMQRARHTRAELSRFLFTRGLWLIVIEVILMRLAFDFTYRLDAPILLITLWALGAAMIVLAALCRLPDRVLAIVSVAMILLHNLSDGIQAQKLGGATWVWTVLHQPGVIRVPGALVIVGYPILPLAATMGAGYCLGACFFMTPERRVRLLLRLGLALTFGFFVVRAVNVYGDPVRWRAQGSSVMTVLSFLNITKYPASLDFLLMTLGPAILVLAALDRVRASSLNPLLVFGRVPLFYFVTHFFLAHLILVCVLWFEYGSVPFLLLPPPSMGGPSELFPKGFGYSLGAVYLIWSTVVVAMYPLCVWYAGVKARGKSRWWSYV